MDKRIFAGVGIAAIVAVGLWLAMGSGRPSPPDDQAVDAHDPVPPVPARAAESKAAGVIAQPAATTRPPMSDEALPIDVAPGFEYLSKPASEMKDTDSMWTLWRRHQNLQAEPRDPEWAPHIEAAIRKSIEKTLSDRGHGKDRLDLPVVECRTHGCEFQVTGRIDNTQQDFHELQQVLMVAMAGPVRHEFDDEEFAAFISMSPDQKQLLYLAHLSRKKP